jgi:hypothetical protein
MRCRETGSVGALNKSGEFAILNFDPSFIDAVGAMLERDFSNSRRVSLEDYTRRWLPFRLSVRLANLLSPIL